ncbi:MAG: ketose-bisphosphate aldolase [Actinobacteria bacterium]|nr:ketose-bisphosphate aldolase [Actinomycetota bacterium]
MLMSGAEVVGTAYRHGFAVPAFNISDYGMLAALVAECEAAESPVIVSIHPAEWALVGDAFLSSARELAAGASVPVAIQLDHGSTFAQVVGAIRLGFSSVMIDGSLLPYEQNVALTRKVVEAAHSVGVSVEAEIGTIGPRDPKSAAEMKDFSYTTPEEAAAFVAATDVDYLAIAVGTAHGVYPPGVEPELKLDLVSQIREAVDVPLVLHGGSGARDAEVSEAVRRGIAKVNISADMKSAYFVALREVLTDPKQREPHDIYPPALDAMRQVVRHKAEVCGSAGGAQHYGYRPAGLRAPSWTAAEVLDY